MLTPVQYRAQGPGAAPYPLDGNNQPQRTHEPSPFLASSRYHPHYHRVPVATTCNLNDVLPVQPDYPLADGSYTPLPDELEYEFTEEDDIRYLRQRGVFLEPGVEHNEPIGANDEPAVDNNETQVENNDSDNESLHEVDEVDDTDELIAEHHRKYLALHSGGKTLNGQQPPAHLLTYPPKTPSLEASSSISGDDSDHDSIEENDSNLVNRVNAVGLNDNNDYAPTVADSSESEYDSSESEYDTDGDLISRDPQYTFWVARRWQRTARNVREFNRRFPRHNDLDSNTGDAPDSDDEPLTSPPPECDEVADSNHANDQPEVARHASSGPVTNTRPTSIARPIANAPVSNETNPRDDLPEEEHEFYQLEESSNRDDQSDDESKDPNYRSPDRARKRRAPPKKNKVKTKKRVSTASSSRAKSIEEPSDSELSLLADSTSESETEPNDPNMITPPTPNVPLPTGNGANTKSPARAANTSSLAGSQSKADTGVRDSKAQAANASSPIGPQSGEARREGEKLATDLNQLQASSPALQARQPTDFQVRSPPLQPEESTSITQSTTNGVPAQSPPSMPLDIPRRQESTNSSSTEGSQGHPYPPSSLSDYTPEGYLKSMMPNAEQQQVDPTIAAGALIAIDAADAAIMRLNGTSSVHTSASAQQGTSNLFGLPGGFAGFTDPYNRNNTGMPRPPPMHPSRQMSTSTESASTSSEEEDICVPKVVRANMWEREPQPPVSRLPFDPYVPSALQHRSPVSNPRSNNTPRGSLADNGNGYTAEPAALPLGATAHSPRGTTNSVPAGIVNNESSEDDEDDGETVGDRSSRSRSTSSEIQEEPTVSKGKRKAAPAPSAHAPGKTAGKAPVVPKGGDKPDGRPNKRRRSEVSDSQIDPSLKAEVDDVKMESEDESSGDSDEEDVYNSDDAEYDVPSRPRAKPRRAIAGRSKAAPPKAATTKKTKPFKAPAKPSSDGTTQCDYVAPYPVSSFSSSVLLELTFSHTHDAHIRSRVNTIFPDTRIDTLLKSARQSHRVYCLKTRLLSGLPSRTVLLSSVLNVIKPLPGKSPQLSLKLVRADDSGKMLSSDTARTRTTSALCSKDNESHCSQ